MRFLHLMKEEKFLDRIRAFYNENFNNGNHDIGLVSFQKGRSLKDNSLSIRQFDLQFGSNKIKNCFELVDLAKGYDYVVFHSFQFVSAISQLLWLAPLSFRKKVVWIEWGADLYKNYKGVYKLMIDRFKSSIACFVAIFPPDMEVYRKKYPHSNAQIYYAPYCGPSIPFYFLTQPKQSRLIKKRNEGVPVVVQIGQNASSTLNHNQVLETISKFSGDNIQLLLPLSYGGDESYADSVEEHAIRVFGDKVTVLRELLPVEEYFSITDDVDIAIFQTWRQAGLGNIDKLLWNNVKIYLPEDSIMYRYYHDSGVPVYKTEDIVSQSFDQFTAPAVIEEPDKYQKFWNQMLSMEWRVNLWKNIYENLSQSKNI